MKNPTVRSVYRILADWCLRRHWCYTVDLVRVLLWLSCVHQHLFGTVVSCVTLVTVPTVLLWNHQFMN